MREMCIRDSAKALRSYAEPIITWAKKGDLHSRRLAIAKLGDKNLVAEIFDKAAQGMWADRNGGYTRIMKLSPRKGDCAEMDIIEIVSEPCTPKAKKAAQTMKAAAPKVVEAEEAAEDVYKRQSSRRGSISAVQVSRGHRARSRPGFDQERPVSSISS